MKKITSQDLEIKVFLSYVEIIKEDEDGNWTKTRVDENNNVIHYEDSSGNIVDNRYKPKDGLKEAVAKVNADNERKDKAEDFIRFWAKQLEYKKLSEAELYENVTWLIKKLENI